MYFYYSSIKPFAHLSLTVRRLNIYIYMFTVLLISLLQRLHGPSMFAVRAKIYGVLYNQASLIAFDETSSYWSALK